MRLDLLALILGFCSISLAAFYLVPYFQGRLANINKNFKAPKVAEVDKISLKLDAIFINIPYKRIFNICLLLVGGLGLLGFILTKNILGLVIGAAIGLIIPSLALKIIISKRRSSFRMQLIDSLMILSSSLRAGLSLVQAIEELAAEMPAPISQEFNLLLRENRMGVSLEEALKHLKKRVNLEELDLVVTTILVSRETGGDLTEVFTRLALTIREQNKLMGRVNSLCIQGKLQGIIMILLPVFFAVVMYGMNPHFFDTMLKSSIGQGALLYAVISEIIGAFLIMKLSKIEV